MRTPAALAAASAAAARALGDPSDAHTLFPTRVPAEWLNAGLPVPLLAQVLPDARESETVAGYGCDPVGDLGAQVAPGVLHKYRGRVLLVATGACAVHCRYCFRRHFPYAAALAARDGWRRALTYLGAQRDVSEVILSGGDPLVLETRKLAELTAGLARLPHVARLRIHTRMPVVVPSRVDRALVAWLTAMRPTGVIVLHVNHAAELTDRARAALARLRSAGLTLLNQSVLLAGINDRVDALVELSERLFASGVLPYYLHMLDPVAGAHHFDLPETRGRDLAAALHARLPGYLVPRLVRERPGDAGKRAVAWEPQPR